MHAIRWMTAVLVCSTLSMAQTAKTISSKDATAAAQSSAVTNAVAKSSSAQASTGPAQNDFASEDAKAQDAPEKGFTYSTSFAGTHNSASGWAMEMTNAVHYDFTKHWGVEASLPVYFLHNGTNPNTVVKKDQTPPLDSTYNALGDMVFSLGFALPDSKYGYTATFSGTAPTGSQDTGISTGRATYDFNNHVEHDFNWLTPMFEMGIGDSSALINKHVRRPYTTLGTMAHAKVGVSRSLFQGWNFEVDGYENMPLADQTIYSHILRRSSSGKITKLGKNGKLHHFQIASVATGKSLAEDNGITPTLSKDFSRHVGFSIAYDRSFRQRLDTLTMTMAYTLGHKAAAEQK